MPKMRIDNNNVYRITKRKSFNPCILDTNEDINFVKKIFDFAYDMSFGKGGEHRSYRSGGLKKRNILDIFIDSFQGKLAEYALYLQLKKNGFRIPPPDLSTYGLGSWDDFDFVVNQKTISVKSTKYYGNLLLLEAKDWNEKGEYIPNIKNNKPAFYDYFVLVRICPSVEEILKEYNDNVSKQKLESLVIPPDKHYEYDIPGCMSHKTLVYLIENNFRIPQNAFLNSKDTQMDADNYYIQAGSLKDINCLFNALKNENKCLKS